MIIMPGYVFIGNGFQSGYGMSNIQRIIYTQFLILLEQSDIVLICMLGIIY